MGLPWVRLDTQFPSNPKILELAEANKYRAAFVSVCGLTYSGGHGTDGFIPVTALPFIHANRQTANQLAEVGLWIPSKGGWDINGFDEFQLSDDAAKKRRERAQKGAAARWDNARRAAIHGL